MKRRFYWGIGLIALIMLVAHLAVISIDSERRVEVMALQALLMFGWSLVIAFAVRGEIREIKYGAAIVVFFHVIVEGGILLFGGSGRTILTAFGPLPLHAFLLGTSGLVWLLVFAIASIRKARIDRSIIADPRDLMPDHTTGQRGWAARSYGWASDVIGRSPNLTRLFRTGVLSRVMERLGALVTRPEATPILALEYHPDPAHDPVARAAPKRTAPEPQVQAKGTPVAVTRDAVPAAANTNPKAPEAPPAAPRRAARGTRQQDPLVLDAAAMHAPKSTPPEPARPRANVATKRSPRPEQLDMPPLRTRGTLATALHANTTIEAVAAINNTKEFGARLGIGNKGRFVSASGTTYSFRGLEQLKELVRAELRRTTNA